MELERIVIDEAKTLAKTTGQNREQNLNAAEASILALNQSKPGSAEWRMEAAQRLIHLAEQIARDGKPENVAELAERALKHLKVVDTPAHDPEIRAAAKSLVGFVQERYLADAEAAQASFEAAAQLDPSNASAKEKAERLKRTLEEVKEKDRAAKRAK